MIGRDRRQRGLLLSHIARMKRGDALDEASYILQYIYVILASVAEIACGVNCRKCRRLQSAGRKCLPRSIPSSMPSQYIYQFTVIRLRAFLCSLPPVLEA